MNMKTFLWCISLILVIATTTMTTIGSHALPVDVDEHAVAKQIGGVMAHIAALPLLGIRESVVQRYGCVSIVVFLPFHARISGIRSAIPLIYGSIYNHS